MAKVTITAIVSFDADTDDADQNLVMRDQVFEAALGEMRGGMQLEELIEWEPAK